MHFETALNLLWVSLGLVALGLLASSEFLSQNPNHSRTRLVRALSVLFVLIFLFPCVSSSDDLISINGLEFTLETRGEFGNPLTHRSNDERPMGVHLARLFELLQNFKISAQQTLLVSFCLLSLVVVATRLLSERYLLAASGRAPPVWFLS